MQRALLPGTKHSTVIHRRERRIQETMAASPLIAKLECEGLFWTGSSRRALQLRPAPYPGSTGRILRGVLFINSHKRLLVIIVTPGVTCHTLCLDLRPVLARYRIAVIAAKR